VMEEAHQEARAMVEAGPLGAALAAFVADGWSARFGLAQVG